METQEAQNYTVRIPSPRICISSRLSLKKIKPSEKSKSISSRLELKKKSEIPSECQSKSKVDEITQTTIAPPSKSIEPIKLIPKLYPTDLVNPQETTARSMSTPKLSGLFPVKPGFFRVPRIVHNDSNDHLSMSLDSSKRIDPISGTNDGASTSSKVQRIEYGMSGNRNSNECNRKTNSIAPHKNIENEQIEDTNYRIDILNSPIKEAIQLRSEDLIRILNPLSIRDIRKSILRKPIQSNNEKSKEVPLRLLDKCIANESKTSSVSSNRDLKRVRFSQNKIVKIYKVE